MKKKMSAKGGSAFGGKTTLKKASYWLSIAVIGIALGLSLQFVRAWVEPTAPAPGGNVGAPINTSATVQAKAGALGVSGAFTAGSGISLGGVYRTTWPSSSGDNLGNHTATQAVVLNGQAVNFLGNAGDPNYSIQSGAWNDGMKYKHWTSHQFLTGGTEKMRIAQNGNVGIGTSNPLAKLDVNGDIMSNGPNTWLFHTPDDGRSSLYFGRGSNGSMSEYPIEFKAGGSANFNGDLKGTRLCIGGDCRNVWPAGGSDGVTYVGGGSCYPGDTIIAYRRNSVTCNGSNTTYEIGLGDAGSGCGFGGQCTGATSCTIPGTNSWTSNKPTTAATCTYRSEALKDNYNTTNCKACDGTVTKTCSNSSFTVLCKASGV